MAPQGGVQFVGGGRQVGPQLRQNVVRVAEARAPHVPHRAAAVALRLGLGLGNVELVAVMVVDDFIV